MAGATWNCCHPGAFCVRHTTMVVHNLFTLVEINLCFFPSFFLKILFSPGLLNATFIGSSSNLHWCTVLDFVCGSLCLKLGWKWNEVTLCITDWLTTLWWSKHQSQPYWSDVMCTLVSVSYNYSITPRNTRGIRLHTHTHTHMHTHCIHTYAKMYIHFAWSDTVHGCMVVWCTQNPLRWQQFHAAPAMPAL